MPELTDLTIVECSSALQEGEISSRELTLAFLERIDRLDPHVKAFITLTPEFALSSASEADKRLSAWRKDRSSHLPELTGVPIAVKDVLAVEGIRCTCGSRILENFIPTYTATAVSRLVDSGMVILGKTNTDEFAMGSSTENSAYFTTCNPWNLSHVPGGSSGGSAAAVAARMAPAALGTDTGGSVRQPASFCGVTGLKPTYGRVSRYGLIAYGSSLDVVGCFGRTAADTALLFMLMAGPDHLDATSMDLPVPSLQLNGGSDKGSLKGMRIGIPQEYFIEGIQSEVETGVREAVSVLESLGAEAVPISLPHTEYALPVYYLVAPAEASANLARYDGVRYGPRVEGKDMWDIFFKTRGEKFGAEVKRRIMLGTYALSAGYYDAYYGQAQKVRTLIKRDFDEAFKTVDLIAAPVAPTTAFRAGEHTEDPLAMYLEDVFTLPANLAGVPGLAFPVGFDHNNLPIGIQLMGPHFKEEVLFKAAYAYQKSTGWHLRRPELE
ncbi:MAG: Asp-tRNA(Asn)/Glu-tRNA(Gln) amidotransferase subunit GatA [Chloroflexi bacterium]|nr:MAG: Asp-tRNA(Asn)/Glu-tRNA(Gln) amidotransferase subunit GatA [Chloroflexota bacterium]